jgi:hypothetical protein
MGRASIITLLAVLAGVAGGQAVAAPHARSSASCSGSITQKIGSKTQRAGSIKTHGISCKKGKSVVKSFLHKAATKSSCLKAAKKPAPTSGCKVSGYHCFLGRKRDYCATVSGKEVDFKLRVVKSSSAAAAVRILCLNKAGSAYVKRAHPSKCAAFGPGGSFGGGVNLRGLKWHAWGHSTARASGIEGGFHLPLEHTPVKVKAYRIVSGSCGRVYSRLRATSKHGSTTVKLKLCPGKSF